MATCVRQRSGDCNEASAAAVVHRRVFSRAAWRAWVVVGLLGGCAAEPVQQDDPRDRGGIIHFSGSISGRSVDAFMARHADERVERVVVDSPGGDVAAGIRLANWIADRHADVEVENLCASSCANYLFAAGRRKVIDDRALVLWHGSILQKDFRERGADCDRRIATLDRSPAHDVEQTRREREAEVAYCDSYRQTVESQRAFFARVGVDEYITRMGQEPRAFDGIWTVPVAVMKRMGLHGVEARAEYGSHDDLKHWNHDDDTETILSLGFDADGHVIELAR